MSTAADLHPSVKAIRTTQLGIAVSIVLVFVKSIAGHLGHSYALIADASETGADVFSSLLLWAALRVSLKPADEEHPYGHGKAEPIAAVVISLFLMGAAVWIGFNSIHFIRTPHEMPKSFTLGVLGVVILIKESLFRYVFAIGKKIGSSAVQADAWHHRSDAIMSIAAFVGITIALICGKGYEQADDWAALLASGLIVYNAIHILRPALNEIMDSAPDKEIVQNIRTTAGTVPGVHEVEKCFVRKMGFDFYVDIHVLVNAQLTVAAGHDIAHAVKDALKADNNRIKDVLVHVEPY